MGFDALQTGYETRMNYERVPVEWESDSTPQSVWDGLRQKGEHWVWVAYRDRLYVDGVQMTPRALLMEAAYPGIHPKLRAGFKRTCYVDKCLRPEHYGPGPGSMLHRGDSK